jgi:hypothetical protein
MAVLWTRARVVHLPLLLKEVSFTDFTVDGSPASLPELL